MTTTPGLATTIMSDSTSALSTLVLRPSGKMENTIPGPLQCDEGKYPAERYLAIMSLMPDLKHASTQLKERAAEHLARLQWGESHYLGRIVENLAWGRCKSFLSLNGCPSNLYTLIYIMTFRIDNHSLTSIPLFMAEIFTKAGYDMFTCLTGDVVPGNEDDQSGSEDDQAGTGFPDASPVTKVAHGLKRQGNALADTRRKKRKMNAGDAVLEALTRHEVRTALEQRRFRQEVEEALKQGFAGQDGQLQADIASHDYAQGHGDAGFHNEIADKEDAASQHQAIQDSNSHILRVVYQDNGYIEDGEEDLDHVYKDQAVQGGAGRIHDWLQELGEGYDGDDEQDVVSEN